MSTSQPTPPTIIIGLSGPSSSGKTTLARLLRTVFNIPASPETNGRSSSLFIFHEDDVYKTDKDIPTITTPSGRTLQDWDCVSALDLPLLESTLRHISTHGTLPPSLYSKEDRNSAGEHGVPESTIQSIHSSVASWLATLPLTHLPLCILDGFLLYPNPSSHPPSISPSITSLLSIKLFLRTSRALLESRRAARSGYVTLETFWEDPEGYVDEVVWPNYVREHAWMFDRWDCDEGEVVEELVGRRGAGVCVAPGKGEVGMEGLVEWAVGTVKAEVERVLTERMEERGRRG